MKAILTLLLLCCCLAPATAQSNYVKNGDFEKFNTCPVYRSQLSFATDWTNGFLGVDSLNLAGADYFNFCTDTSSVLDAEKIPNNPSFYQNPHSGSGLTAIQMYYDKFPPKYPASPPQPYSYREHLQGRLYKKLTAGKSYCVSFWVSLAEVAGYGQNKIGAYLDDGSISILIDTPNKEVSTVSAQVYTDSIIIDTMGWTKIEGTFVANGTESYITIGNFFPNSAVSTIVTNYYHVYEHESFYVVDDICVVPIDAQANAGVDRWVEMGKSIDIGAVEDSTAVALDCKWYHKGSLIDSGAVIRVDASTILYAIDTYVVEQTVCGNITRDTMLLRTVGLGMNHTAFFDEDYKIYPNPNNGSFVLTSVLPTKVVNIKIYDLLGKVIYNENLHFTNRETSIQLNASGVYIVELTDESNNKWRERVLIE